MSVLEYHTYFLTSLLEKNRYSLDMNRCSLHCLAKWEKKTYYACYNYIYKGAKMSWPGARFTKNSRCCCMQLPRQPVLYVLWPNGICMFAALRALCETAPRCPKFKRHRVVYSSSFHRFSIFFTPFHQWEENISLETKKAFGSSF